MTHDFLIVGSGCSGVQAAQTLLEGGATVGLIDVGGSDDTYAPLIPPGDFRHTRMTDPEQHRYFLGDRYEGIPAGPAEAGAQLTPPRQYITRHSQRLAPFAGQEFTAVQGLARGGLGSAWGLGSHVFNPAELTQCGLDPATMYASYDTIARRIGISGQPNDIAPFSLGPLTTLQPPLEIDENSRAVLAAYEARRAGLNRAGFFLGRCPLALLSQDLGARRKTSLTDMEFWSDEGGSAYRPWLTLRELERHPNFSYLPGRLALRFAEGPEAVEVEVQRTDTLTTERVSARRLLLAAGTLATGRIVIRSMNYAQSWLPYVCNPFTYLATLNLRRLGKASAGPRHSVAQLVMFLTSRPFESVTTDDVMISMFSYRSLLLFRLLKDLPFNFADGLKFGQFLQGALTLATINYADFPSPEKRLQLTRSSESMAQDVLEGHYRLRPEEVRAIALRNRKIMGVFWRLGCIPAKKIELNPGASIHYAGTLPFSDTPQAFHTAADGRLHETARVYIADGSAFRYLPAKGPTLTFMAHAHRVAQHALQAR